MQLAAQGADLLGQPPLDRHVDVFVQRQEGETSLLQLALHALQPSDDFLTLSAGEDLLLNQHAAMGHATADVIQRQTFIERQGRSERLHHRVGRCGEPPGPGFVPNLSFHGEKRLAFSN